MFSQPERALLESRLRSQFRSLTTSGILRALLPLALVLMGVPLPVEASRTTLLVAAGAAAVPLLAVAVLCAVAPKPSLAWVALGLDIVCFGVLGVMALPNLLAVVLLALPLGTLVRAVLMHRLVRALT